jgi:hypothetical protein
MSRLTVAVLIVLAFVAGVASQTWLASSLMAQGQVSPLTQIDLGDWCPGAQRRMIDGKPVESFKVGDIVMESPAEISESDILAPTKVLLFRIAEKGKPLTVRLP